MEERGKNPQEKHPDEQTGAPYGENFPNPAGQLTDYPDPITSEDALNEPI